MIEHVKRLRRKRPPNTLSSDFFPTNMRVGLGRRKPHRLQRAVKRLPLPRAGGHLGGQDRVVRTQLKILLLYACCLLGRRHVPPRIENVRIEQVLLGDLLD